MHHRLWILSLVVGSLAFAALGGCQSASSAATPGLWTQQGEIEAQRITTPRVQRGEGRVHVLLAQRVDVDLPVEVNQKRVRLGAGDALGEQMFERYASLVRLQQRPDDREFVEADAVESNWIEQLVMAIALR